MKLKYSAKAHGYWLNGKRCKSPSAIAKVPDDSSALDFWRRRQTAIGLALQPHLLTAVAANADDKKALDAICEEAMTAAGASSGRDYGTAVHKITDLLDGGVFVLETPEVVAIRETWRTLLDSHDLEIVASEQVIVHPDLMVAGRFDRVVRHRSTGECFILDTKTGKSAADFLQSHAVQLWLYASAPLCADGPSGDVDFEVARFVPMHAVSQSVALVAHLPMEGEASIIGIDIAAGRECFERVIQPTWVWRSRSDLRVDSWTNPTSAPPAPAPPDRAANLVDRLRAVAALSPDVAQRVREAWPAGCPKLSEGGHTAEQLDQIQQIVEQAETITSAPFADLPTEPAPLRTVNVAEVRARVVPDEGEPAGEGRMVQMRELHAALDDVQRAWIAALADQSRAVASFHLAERKTLRSTRIVRGLIALAQNDCMDDDLVRAAAAFALDSDEPLQASIPPGAAIAALGWTEALTFQTACETFVEGRMTLAFDDTGVMRLVDRPLTADQAAERLGGTWA
jgi:hypothetical protein